MLVYHSFHNKKGREADSDGGRGERRMGERKKGEEERMEVNE